MPRRNVKNGLSFPPIWHIIRGYLKGHVVKAIIFIIGVIVTILITKACNHILPDDPIIVKQMPDTIKVVHIYEPLANSTFTSKEKDKAAIETRLNSQIINRKEENISDIGNVNKPLSSSLFPKGKGYTIKNSTPYFSLEMSQLTKPYVDFSLSFFNKDVLADIYCLSIKVFKVQNGERIYILDENYNKRQGKNIIRLKNIFTKGNYEIEVGFIFSKDRNAEYPNFYREIKYVNNSPKLH
jgi:hypothetical protein